VYTPQARYAQYSFVGDEADTLHVYAGNRKLMLREGDRIEKLTAIRAAIRSLFVSAAKGKTAAVASEN
jgi:hypothetical protein